VDALANVRIPVVGLCRASCHYYVPDLQTTEGFAKGAFARIQIFKQHHVAELIEGRHHGSALAQLRGETAGLQRGWRADRHVMPGGRAHHPHAEPASWTRATSPQHIVVVSMKDMKAATIQLRFGERTKKSESVVA
jgi:ribosomal protein L22